MALVLFSEDRLTDSIKGEVCSNEESEISDGRGEGDAGVTHLDVLG